MKYTVRTYERKDVEVEAESCEEAINKALWPSNWEEVELAYADVSVHQGDLCGYFREAS